MANENSNSGPVQKKKKTRKLIWTVDPVSGLLIAQNAGPLSRQGSVVFRRSRQSARAHNLTRRSSV